MKLLFSALVVAAFLPLPISESLSPSLNAFWQAAVLLLLLASLLFLQRSPAYPLSAAWAIAATCATFGVLTASINAIDFRAHWIVSIPLIIYIYTGPRAIKRLVDNHPKSQRLIAIAFLIGQTASAVTAILQSLGIAPILGELQLVGRSSGLAGHPNTLGLMSGIAICALIHYIFTAKGLQLTATILLALNCAALLSSGSVSALLATTIGVATTIYAMRLASTRIFVSTIALSFMLAGYTAIASQLPHLPNPFKRMQQVTGQTSDIGSWDIRTDVYGYAASRILENPITGVGMDYESGVFIHPLVGQVLTHNILLRGWLQGGILLFISLGVIYIATLLVLRNSNTKRLHATSCGVLALVLSFALTSAALYQTYYWLIIITAWGTLIRTQIKTFSLSPLRNYHASRAKVNK